MIHITKLLWVVICIWLAVGSAIARRDDDNETNEGEASSADGSSKGNHNGGGRGGRNREMIYLDEFAAQTDIESLTVLFLQAIEQGLNDNNTTLVSTLVSDDFRFCESLFPACIDGSQTFTDSLSENSAVFDIAFANLKFVAQTPDTPSVTALIRWDEDVVLFDECELVIRRRFGMLFFDSNTTVVENFAVTDRDTTTISDMFEQINNYVSTGQCNSE